MPSMSVAVGRELRLIGIAHVERSMIVSLVRLAITTGSRGGVHADVFVRGSRRTTGLPGIWLTAWRYAWGPGERARIRNCARNDRIANGVREMAQVRDAVAVLDVHLHVEFALARD